MIPIRAYKEYWISVLTRIPEIKHLLLVYNEADLASKIRDFKANEPILVVIVPSSDGVEIEKDDLKDMTTCLIYLVCKQDSKDITDVSEMAVMETTQDIIYALKALLHHDATTCSAALHPYLEGINFGQLHIDPERNYLGCNGWSMSFNVVDPFFFKSGYVIDGDETIVYIHQGPQGEQGIQGPAGTNGSNGAQGLQGLQGIQGIQGPQGEQGLQGPQGIQGVKGDAGLGFYFQGDVATTADLPIPGTPGHAYIVQDTDSLFVANQLGEWIDGGSIQGPQGPQGVQGLQGVQGVQGVQGIQGVPGTAAASVISYPIIIPQSNFGDGQTYYVGMIYKGIVATAGRNKVYIRKSGVLDIAELYWYGVTTAGSNENISIYVQVNGGADTLIATIGDTNAEKVFSNANLNIAVNAGDYFEIKIVCPTWATNPVGVSFGGIVTLKY